MGDPVTWFDLGAKDPEPLWAFYGSLFGWHLTPSGPSYTMVGTGGGIRGGIGRSQTGDPWCAFYVDVADPQATLDRAVALGGSMVVPVTEIRVVTYAMLADPDGLLVGLTKAVPPEDDPMPPVERSGAVVDWFEVLGSDAARSQAFYAELFGWTYAEDGGGYAFVDTGAGRGIGGAVGAAGDGSWWATVYATVEDTGAMLARAEELGGARVYGPLEIDGHVQTGAFRDPAGNVFGLYHHEEHA